MDHSTLLTMAVQVCFQKIFLRQFMLLEMMIILPRQARDKHRESSTQKEMLTMTVQSLRPIMRCDFDQAFHQARKNRLSLSENDHFFKTGSGRP
jgi:hypothetical protein